MPNIQEILLETFRKLLEHLQNFAPKFLGALVLIIIGYVVAKLVSKLSKAALDKAGIDRLGEKLNQIDIVRKLGDIKLSIVISKSLYYFIMLVFLTAATETLGMKVLTDMVESIVNMIPKAVASVFMLILGVLIAEKLKQYIIKICKSMGIESGKLIANFAFFFFLIISIIASLKQIGIETGLLESSFNLILGGVIVAFAIGYGMASRDVLANILSSFYSKNKFKEGQVILIDDIKGEIISINNTSIVLKTGETQTILPLHMLQVKKIEILN
ncbi:Mechanosensitive ion channel [Pseudarcicella hirudinis]|uniref:Mechanosensitive ion channel n=1 Tax=Pseudarcicella hirudinis TaxID=1079859 RepID=A0A1I5UGP3_9BACT|nr:mechanosensitive ion channel [Pseudarcicella hirudinis]SFP94400.1 Mechanosensitive ion channel [Pseudarcicella hirudinis]